MDLGKIYKRLKRNVDINWSNLFITITYLVRVNQDWNEKDKLNIR